jgi:hypothetical protein
MKKHAIFMMCRALLIAVGVLLLLNALGVSMASNFNLGIVLAALLGTFLVACGIFLPFILRRCPRWLWISALCAITLVVLCATSLLLFGRTDTVTKNEDAIIVLGAGIHGERVSLTLRDRLDAAIDCYEQNPDAIIVVSGGQGPQEDIPEDTGPEDEEAVPAIDEDGWYYSSEDVSLYLYTYGRLPENFITKDEARELGWEGGSVEKYAPGYAIGGDKFGNREGLLPKASGRAYYECDIDTNGANSRGAKRIVFSNDGLIYYTDDHYESFTLLYGEE